MGKPAHRQSDSTTGHDACGSRTLPHGSPNVFINGLEAGRVTDSHVPHGCIVHPPHTGQISAGSSTVFINGLPAARIGDAISCGGSCATGSPNVFIGD